MSKKIILWDCFPHRKCVYLCRPGLLVRDLIDMVRYAWQRALYGWDEDALWSLDSWVCERMIPMIEELKNKKYGVNGLFIPDDDPYDLDAGYKRQNEAYDIMIEGFRAGLRLKSINQDADEEQKDEDLFNKGMDYFHKYFFTLWN